MSLYLNLLAQNDLEKASKIVKDLDVPMPSDLVMADTEEECIK